MNSWSYDQCEELGKGGFGTVYAATGPGNDNLAAKLISKAKGGSREQLIVTDLPNSPHILPVLYVDETDSAFVLYMPRATMSLRDRMQRPISSAEALEILQQIAVALELLSDKIVHRDLKPENILFVDGAWALCDFGIARFAEATTSVDTFKGSLSAAYAAPEQWRYERATSATDVYAFGIIAYELFTGKHPFSGSADDMRNAHLTEAPLGMEGPRKLAWLVSECLTKAPQARPTAAAVVIRLAKAGGEATSKAASALAQAQTSILEARARQEARAQAELTEHERRAALYRAANSGYEAFTQEVIDFISDSAPETQVSSHKGLILTLNGAALAIEELAPGSETDDEWDVIAYTSIRVELGHQSRSHSLYFADFETPGQYSWFELGFMGGFSADFDNEPKSVAPGEGILAIAPVLGGLQIAWGIKMLDPGSPEEFVEAWAERFGQAALNRFPRLSRLPDGKTTIPRR